MIDIKKSSDDFKKGFKVCMHWVKEYCKDHPEEKLSHLGGLIHNSEMLEGLIRKKEASDAKDT